MTKTLVRESANNPTEWVVDIIGDFTLTTGYVQPDGKPGPFCGFDTRDAAEAADDLYLGAPAVKRELVLHPESANPGEKLTNPKDIIGVLKAPVSTLSGQVLWEIGLGMLEGARKYGRHNYRAMGVSATVYYDAAVGHLMDWFEGEDIDSDSGMSHVTKAITALVVLRDSMLMGNWIDDRPMRNPHGLNKKSFNAKAKEIIEKYPNAKAPYLETDSEDRKCGRIV